MIKRQYGEIPTLETRSEANESVNREKRYAQIIEILIDFPDGLTAKEIACKMFEKKQIPLSERNFTAPRLTELSQKGLVEPIGKKKCQYTGKTVAVYALRENQSVIFDFI